jgi:hypothetical protein
MKAMITDCQELLVEIECWRRATSQRLADAETGLLSLAHRMLVLSQEMAGDDRDLGTADGWKDGENLSTRPVRAENL